MRKLALFRFVFRSTTWIRNSLTPTGRLIAGLTGFSAAFGLDTQANVAHVVFALGSSLLLVDAVAAGLARRWAPKLVAERRVPPFITAGQSARYSLMVRNVGQRVLPASSVVERMHQPWPGSIPVDSGAAGNRFDQRVGYPAYLAILRRLRVIDGDRVDVPPLRPGQCAEIVVTVVPNARGLAAFESLYAIIAGPLGLVERLVAVDAPQSTLPVLPMRSPVNVPPMVSHRLLHPGGISLSQHVGEAEEFRSLRDYRPGDPIRAIHWRSFARTGHPVVREYQDEFFARQALVLDTAAPTLFSPAFERAVSIAAWLVARPRESDCLLDLMFVGDHVHRLTAGRGLGGADALLRILAVVQPSPENGVEALLTSLDRHAPQISSVIAIFLVWDEARKQAVRRLMARGLRLMVFLVTSDKDPSPSVIELPQQDADWTGILQKIDSQQPISIAGGA